MAVIRVEKNKDYSVMSNYHLKDKNLSLNAKGLLSVMLSLPENWDYSIEGLVSISKEGNTAIKTILKELKEYSYLVVYKKNSNNGKFDYEYVIYEQPHIETPPMARPPMARPSMVRPTMETPTMAVPLQLNTNILNTNNNICLFEEFWSAYPKKKAKDNALKSFNKLKVDRDLLNTMLNAIEKQKQTKQWKEQNGQFIPYPSSWLNGGMWKDEVEVENTNEQKANEVKQVDLSYKLKELKVNE